MTNGEQAADSSRHSTPVSSSSKLSVGSKGSRGSSNQAAANGELDNSLEELTMSRDDQVKQNPHLDKLVLLTVLLVLNQSVRFK